MKPRLCWRLVSVVGLISCLFSMHVSRAEQLQQIGSDGRLTYRSSYVNPIFGYSVTIPDDLIGIGVVPPAPNHGVTIVLDNKTDSRIELDAEYNALDFTSARQQAESRMNDLKEWNGATRIRTESEVATTLCDLTAVRQTVEYNDESGTLRLQEAVFALFSRQRYSAITYEISLWTTPDRLERDRPLFFQVLRSFKCTPPTG